MKSPKWTDKPEALKQRQILDIIHHKNTTELAE